MKNGILLTENSELQIKVIRDANGLITSGLVIGDVTYQNQNLLLKANPGEIKEHPLMGVGIEKYAESNDGEALAREIRSQFTRDGMTVNKIAVKMPNVQIDAYYK